MSEWKFYYNPECSKCREALRILQTYKANFEAIEYLKTPPSAEEIRLIISQLNVPASALVRVKDSDFINAPFDVNSIEEVVQQLSKNPRLMERPVLQGNGQAVIGRPPEKIEALLKS